MNASLEFCLLRAVEIKPVKCRCLQIIRPLVQLVGGIPPQKIRRAYEGVGAEGFSIGVDEHIMEVVHQVGSVWHRTFQMKFDESIFGTICFNSYI